MINGDTPSSFTKWAFGIFTIIIVGGGAWGFDRLNSTYDIAVSNKQRTEAMEHQIIQIREDFKETRRSQEDLMRIFLQILAEEKVSNLREERRK